MGSEEWEDEILRLAVPHSPFPIPHSILPSWRRFIFRHQFRKPRL
jgi:hypothetical protein